MSCIADINKHTNPDEYELILIEDVVEEVENTVPKGKRHHYKFRDPWGKYKIDKHIILEEKTSYSKKMNLAAKYANGEYLMFVQNDVFVDDNWLSDLRYYLENDLADCMIPNQFPLLREEYLLSKKETHEENLGKGHRDACLVAITKDAFEKVGGFNEELEAFVEADFYGRFPGPHGLRINTTSKVSLTHIQLGTHYQDMDEFNRKMTHDSRIRNG